MRRRLPNILITGTPGTGKSTLSSELSQLTGMEWINVGDLAKANNLYEEYDETLQCHVLDEDGGYWYDQGWGITSLYSPLASKFFFRASEVVISELEDKIDEGGKIVDYHGCDFFPQNWFDIVFVLTTNNTILYDRLARRGYNEVKIRNNIEAEIFQTLLDEAKAAYDESIVHPLKSDTPEDMENNLDKITEWVKAFESNNQSV